MANIVLKTFAAGDEGQGTVTPQDDSLIYQNAVSVNGIFEGATVTLTGANTLHVASGFGIICGRFFEINESDISVQLSSSGTLSGRLKIHLDLNNADNPIEIVTETGATLPALSGDSNININGGAFDMELCTFSVNELTISSLVNTFPTIDNTSKQIRRKTAYAVNDFVLCQSASNSLIFICTTAGITAIQEPKAYATVTDGNTVTDGTAVFKAVSVSGQITQISKIGNLSNLNTTDKTSLVVAVNEVVGNIGSLNSLDTDVRTSIVNAINNLYAQVNARNAGSHNAIYRGKNLGTSVTAAQWASIQNGTFLDMYIGDYWVINGITWRIAAFDYWLGFGDPACSTHHIVIVPDENLLAADGSTTHYMNTSNVTTGAYIGSGFRSGTNADNTSNTARSQCRAKAQAAFGNAHILTHRELFANAMSNGRQSSVSWYDSDIDLMNEIMVYGCHVFAPTSDGSTIPANYTIGNSQLPLFRLNHKHICNRAHWWLRDAVSEASFARVSGTGDAACTDASYAGIGVRPAFGIC